MRVVLALLMIATAVFAEAPDSLWTRLYGGSSWDNAVGGVPDQSGGFVLAGQTQSYGPSGQNGYLVRTNAIGGDTVFTHWYGGSASDVFSDVHVTPGQMLAVGATSSYGANPQNAWLVCTNALGDTVWTRALDLGGNEAALAVDHDVDYFVAGYAWPVGGQPDLMVSKFTDSGTELWTSTLGGTGIDWAYDVLALPDGGCAVVGETYNNGIGSPPFSNAWLVRYDAAGDTVWTQTYGDSAAYERGNAIIATSDGGFAIVGYREGQSSDQDVLLIKTDANGVLEWSRAYGGSGDDGGIDLVSPCADGYFIGGYTQSYGAGGNDAYLIRTNAVGDTVWSAVYGGANSDVCYAVSDRCGPFYHDGYYAAGSTQSGSAGPQDAWLIRLDGDPLIAITSPAACAEFVIGDQISVQWFTQGTNTYSYVRVELNRDYPTGGWEVLADSIYNAGFTQFTAAAPASPRCAVRVTKLGGSPASDVSELFRIRPPGNFTDPGLVWDSTYNGGAGLGHVITTSDGKYASNYGRSIVKRDSVGGEVWSAVYLFDDQLWTDPNSFAITELSNGDLIAVGAIDTIELTQHRPRMITMRADEGGTPLGPMSLSILSNLPTTGRDVIADEAGDGYWALADVYHPNVGNNAGVFRAPAGGGGWAREIDEVAMDARCCATADNDGLLIAGEIGDYFANTRDLFLLRLDSSGDTLWTRSYDFGQNEAVSAIHRLATGGYVVAGHSFPALGSSTDYLIVELDHDGNLVQQWNYDRDYYDEVGGVNEDLDGGVLIAGTSKQVSQPSVAQLIKFGCGGSLVWNLNWTHGDGQSFSDVDLAPGGGYIVSGSRTIPSGGGGFAVRPVLTKYGTETWTVPTCPKADSLVIQFNSTIPANILTWKGTEQGVYFVYARADFDTTHGAGAGWSLIGCVQPSPPDFRSQIQFYDVNPSPARKFYYVVHDCNGSCGGGGED